MNDDITILCCPQCGFPRIRDCGNGLYQCDDCGTHFDKDENIVLTEQEWLQTCDTEQLAEAIYYLTWFHTELDERLDKNVKNGRYNNDENIKIVMEWLKQPHKE